MNRPRSRVLSAAAAALAFLLLAGPAAAGPPTDQLRAGIDAVLSVLRDKSLKGESKKAERRTKLRAEFIKGFDFTEMARRSLSTQWKKRNPDEKKEFVAIFTDLIERRYIGAIERYTDEKVRYLKESVDGGYARVKTAIVTGKGQEIVIYYSMYKKGDRWWVYDVMIKGTSLVNNYRAQFRSIIQNTSYAELVKKLQAVREKG